MEGDGSKVSYGTANLTVLTEIQMFLLNHSSDCYKPLVNFQHSERVAFDNILPVFSLLF